MVTVRRIVALAWFVAPLAVAADVAAAAPHLHGAFVPVLRLGVAYATVLTMLIVFRRRALGEVLLTAAALLTLIWAIRTPGDDVGGLATALAGALGGVLPAWLRDLHRLAGERDRMTLRDLRRQRRRQPSTDGMLLLADLRRDARRDR